MCRAVCHALRRVVPRAVSPAVCHAMALRGPMTHMWLTSLHLSSTGNLLQLWRLAGQEGLEAMLPLVGVGSKRGGARPLHPCSRAATHCIYIDLSRCI